MEADDVVAQLKRLAINSAVEPPKQFQQLINDDLKKWKAVAESANIHLD
jgi:tripartite-type tricarboxylate transporter receptor subunit TctC